MNKSIVAVLAALCLNACTVSGGKEPDERAEADPLLSAQTLAYKTVGEAFLTPPGALSQMVADAIRHVTGVETEPSTTGGTSDARFLSRLCPVVEFGLPNATMHKLDEAVALQDISDLTKIYAEILSHV